MTIGAAEKITDLTIDHSPDNFYLASGMIGQFRVYDTDARRAAKAIVDWNWREVCRKRSHQQGYRCLYCKGLKPLQGHHKIKRSQGRRDVVGNVDMLCSACHGAKFGPHGRKS